MLNEDKKISINQISLTGARAIILLGLLIEAPRSLEEIKDEFIRQGIMEGTNSDDVIRIDINTLKTMGCEISRADHRTDNKYVLINHPFKINVAEEEIRALKKTFNYLKETADIRFLIGYDKLFKKIANFLADENLKEQLLGISPLKRYSQGIVNELLIATEKKQIVTMVYTPPTYSKAIEKEILADKLVLKNNKLYIYGVDKNSKESIYLNVKRILKILSRENNKTGIEKKSYTVKFFLKDFGAIGLDDEETILNGNLSDGFEIEGKYHNEFYAVQRILSFGSKCTVIEPEECKAKVIELLKKMRNIYNG